MKNADLFELIYYKLSTYLNKNVALEACNISRKHGISVFSALFKYFVLTTCQEQTKRIRNTF